MRESCVALSIKRDPHLRIGGNTDIRERESERKKHKGGEREKGKGLRIRGRGRRGKIREGA
jgi:hypothetical protein